MKKRLTITIGVFAILAGYLYLTHAYIYFKIGRAHIYPPEAERAYLFSGNTMEEKKLVYASLGDSLTAGVGTEKFSESYPYLLAQNLEDREQPVLLKNFSYSGATTEDLIRDLLTPAIAEQPDIVTLLIGVNDIHDRIDKDVFKNNYRLILDRLTKETQAKIYIISIPYIGANTLILPPHNIYFGQKTDEFNKVIAELADSYKVNYIDLISPTRETFKKNGKHYSADQFHPSAKGYALWAKIIYDSISK